MSVRITEVVSEVLGVHQVRLNERELFTGDHGLSALGYRAHFGIFHSVNPPSGCVDRAKSQISNEHSRAHQHSED